MRYEARKLEEDKYIIEGIKEMLTPNKEEKVEVIIDSKEYSKKSLEELIVAYTSERDGLVEKYNNDLKDMENILEAINNSN